MRDIRLMNTQKAAIHEILVTAGLDPNDFYWHDDTSRYQSTGKFSRLQHAGDGFCAKFDGYGNDENNWTPTISPGEQSREETYEFGSSFDPVLKVVRMWAQLLVRELGTSDPWRPGDSSRELVAVVEAADPEAFSPAERLEAIARVEAVRGVARELAAGTPHERLVDERLDSLVAAVDSQNKQNWLLLAMGTVFNIIVALTLSNSDGQALMTLMVHGIHHLTS